MSLKKQKDYEKYMSVQSNTFPRTINSIIYCYFMF